MIIFAVIELGVITAWERCGHKLNVITAIGSPGVEEMPILCISNECGVDWKTTGGSPSWQVDEFPGA